MEKSRPPKFNKVHHITFCFKTQVINKFLKAQEKTCNVLTHYMLCVNNCSKREVECCLSVINPLFPLFIWYSSVLKVSFSRARSCFKKNNFIDSVNDVYAPNSAISTLTTLQKYVVILFIYYTYTYTYTYTKF